MMRVCDFNVSGAAVSAGGNDNGNALATVRRMERAAREYAALLKSYASLDGKTLIALFCTDIDRPCDIVEIAKTL